MEIISNELKEKIYLPHFLNEELKNKNICFFDIETTGFSRTKDRVILIGILYYQNDKIIIKQFFANSIKDEIKLLLLFKGELSKFDAYITFNGDLFDIPFLNDRYTKNNIDYIIDKDNSIDLLKYIKKYKNILNFENYKLKTIEKNIGIERIDEISGKESVNVYYKYVDTKDTKLKEIILRHNYDDIYYLPKILKIFDLIDEKINLNYKLTFNESIISINVNLSNISIENDLLNIYAFTDKIDLIDQIYFDTNYNFNWDPNVGNLHLQFQIYSGKLSNNNDVIYLDKNDFNFNLNTLDNTKYNVPNNIIILRDNKILIIDNLKSIIKEFLIYLLSIT